MKILTVYTLNSHLLTLKAHNHKIYVLSSTLLFDASSINSVNPDQTAPVEQSDLGPQCFASLLMLNGHYQMQLFCWRFQD